MIDNQDNSLDKSNESAPAPQTEKSLQKASDETALDFARLTHQNWLFINAFIAKADVRAAYQLAKYEGTDESAPYQVFRRLKPYIEAIGDLDVTSRARLQADLKPVLDLPLDPNKTHLTLSEWLRVRKFAGALTPEAKTSKPNISVLVINRSTKHDERDNGQADSTTSHREPRNKVVDAEIIEPK